MYIRSKKWNGKTYYQLVLGAKEMRLIEAHKNKRSKPITMPKSITLPRGIFVPQQWSPQFLAPPKREGGERVGELVEGTVCVEWTNEMHVVRPDHPDYIHACVDAAAAYYRCIVESTRDIEGRKVTERAWREHLKRENADLKLRQMYVCQRLCEQERADRLSRSFREKAHRLSAEARTD